MCHLNSKKIKTDLFCKQERQKRDGRDNLKSISDTLSS